MIVRITALAKGWNQNIPKSCLGSQHRNNYFYGSQRGAYARQCALKEVLMLGSVPREGLCYSVPFCY